MASTLLLNTQHPRLGIFVPALREYRRFDAGRLEIAVDDPAHDFVLERAKKRSDITIVGTVEGEDGQVRQQAIKTAADPALTCSICVPAQTFKNAGLLTLHNKQLHVAAPDLDREGNEGGRQATGATRIAPARRKT